MQECRSNIGALIIRTGFRGPLYIINRIIIVIAIIIIMIIVILLIIIMGFWGPIFRINIIRSPPKSIGNYLGPYINPRCDLFFAFAASNSAASVESLSKAYQEQQQNRASEFVHWL